jgi:hypothetical protein
VRYLSWSIVAAGLLSLSAAAQEQKSTDWANLPSMELERQFGGALRDTVVQRWRDPVDGTICHIYLPIRVVHSPPTASGYVQYGSNTIGSISCVAGASAEVARPRAVNPTSTMFVGLIIQLVAGIAGGNAAGIALREYNLALLGNTIVGAFGGVAGGQLLQIVMPAISGAGGGLDVSAILSQIVAGGIAGAACTFIVGLGKDIAAGRRAR